MASTINASTASGGGVITTADASGILQLQTAGVTGLTIDASQNVTLNNVIPSGSTAPVNGMFLPAASTIGFSTASSERMRIDASGNLLVGTTSALVTPSRIAVVYPGDTTWGIGFKSSYLTGNGQPCTFINSSNVVIGYIGTNGTATSYITSSDYRLKENIIPIVGALDKVVNLNPVTYIWKGTDNEVGEGFIAHELQDICPLAVSGEKDAVNKDGSIKAQGIDPSKIVALLTAAIKELKAIIDTQNARIEALEAK